MAYRIHHALRVSVIDSQMLVNVAASDDCSLQDLTSNSAKAIALLSPLAMRPLRHLLETRDPMLLSPPCIPILLAESHQSFQYLFGAPALGARQDAVDCRHQPHPQSDRVVPPRHVCILPCLNYTNDLRWRDGYHRVIRPAHENGFDPSRHT